MKAYGIPRAGEAADPDAADGVRYALKSSAVRLGGKGGECKSAVRSRRKRHIRITWKRRARLAAKAELRAVLIDPA
ncbi:hypothetical protein [Desulfovibrio sp. ZJ200]|uniref:hypothetical protein n=1 Tax=Desulfovibrio sp. ZJ200 TaxID=2709792 RepID=UPI0013E9EAAB|nr:hypothetical protein [Desulfovibrio sp. ZJ200]